MPALPFSADVEPDVDDVAVLLPHEDAGAGLRDERRPEHVRAPDGLERVGIDLEQRGDVARAGVVDEHVEPAEGLARLGDDPLGVGRHVAYDGDGTDLGRGFLERLGRAADDGDLGAGVAERAGDGEADAGRAAGDERRGQWKASS